MSGHLTGFPRKIRGFLTWPWFIWPSEVWSGGQTHGWPCEPCDPVFEGNGAVFSSGTVCLHFVRPCPRYAANPLSRSLANKRRKQLSPFSQQALLLLCFHSTPR